MTFCRCQDNMKNRISFLCHLSKDHGEFYPRIQRIMTNEMGLKQVDKDFFNEVIGKSNFSLKFYHYMAGSLSEFQFFLTLIAPPIIGD